MSIHAISPYAATWDNADGEHEATASSSTICWYPNNPKDFAAATADGEFEVPFRCRDCPGCRSFEAWVVRKRLAATYGECKETIWVSEFESQSITPSQLSAKVARVSPEKYEQGFFLLSSTRIAKLKLGSQPSKVSWPGCCFDQKRPYKIYSPQSQRSWKCVTRGMMIPRRELGSYLNRYYLTGLAKTLTTGFIKELRGGIRKRHPEAKANVRAYKHGLFLYPSPIMQGREVWATLQAQISARGNRFTTNSRTPKAVVRILHPTSENSAKLTGRSLRLPESFYGSRDASSQPLSKALTEALASLEAAIKRNSRPNDTS